MADRNTLDQRSFWNLAWPAALEGLLLVLLSSVDLLMVSRLGSNATSAVGVFSQPKMVLLCFPRAFSVAITARLSMLLGQQRWEELSPTLKQATLLALIPMSLLLIGAGLALEPILLLAGAESDYLSLALDYGRPMLWSLLFYALSTVLQSGLLAMGFTRRMLAANAIGNLLNIFCNLLLIPRYGVGGAGVGTAIGSAITLILTILLLQSPSAPIHLRGLGGWQPSVACWQGLSSVFRGTLAEQGAERVGMFLYSRLAAGLGTMPFAVHTVCMNLCDLYYCFAQGMGKASLALSAYYTGCGQTKEWRQRLVGAQRLGLLLSGMAFALYVLFRWPLVTLFLPDTAAMALGSTILILVGLVSFPEAQALLCAGALRGMGQTRFVALYSLLSIAVLRPILTWLLCYPLGLSLYGAWAALLLDQTVRAVCATWGCFSRQRMYL